VNFKNLKLDKIVRKILIKYGGYYNGKLFSFEESSGRLKLSPAVDGFSPKIIILSALFYDERQLSFPVESHADLKKLLVLQLHEDEVWLQQQIENGQSHVNTWRFDESISGGAIYLPESLLLSTQLDKGQVFHVSESNEVGESQRSSLFVGKVGNLVYSALRSPIISTPEHFAASAGLSLNEIKEVKPDDKATLLANGMNTVLIRDLFKFKRAVGEHHKKSLVKQVCLPIVILLTAYLGITSSYLYLQSSYLESRLTQQMTESGELLSKKQIIDTNRSVLMQLEKVLGNATSTSGAWLVLLPLLNDADINRVSLRDGKVTVVGRSESASSTLNLVANNPNALNARFDTQVRKTRRGENFRLSFELSQNVTILGNSDGIEVVK